MCCANTNASDSLPFNKDFGIKDIFEIHNSYRIVCPHSSIFLLLPHVFLPYQVSFLWEFIFVLLTTQLHSFSLQNLSIYHFAFCIPIRFKIVHFNSTWSGRRKRQSLLNIFPINEHRIFQTKSYGHISASVDVNVHLLFHCELRHLKEEWHEDSTHWIKIHHFAQLCWSVLETYSCQSTKICIEFFTQSIYHRLF